MDIEIQGKSDLVSKKSILEEGKFSLAKDQQGEEVKELSLEVYHQVHQRNVIPQMDKKNSSNSQWTSEEDQLIVYYKMNTQLKYKQIAIMLDRKNAKQVRERWSQRLDPQINKEKFSFQEQKEILEKSLTQKWASIARSLNNRTDNQVKNQFNSTIKKSLRKIRLMERNESIDQEDLNELEKYIYANRNRKEIQKLMEEAIESYQQIKTKSKKRQSHRSQEQIISPIKECELEFRKIQKTEKIESEPNNQEFPLICFNYSQNIIEGIYGESKIQV